MNKPDILELVSYEDLRSSLQRLPSTWYPDIIRATVEAAYQKEVFINGGASTLVKGIEERIGRD